MSEPVARTPEEWFAILRGEVNELGRALGEAIRTLSGDALFAHEEAVRALTKEARRGRRPRAAQRWRELVGALSLDDAEGLVRAFSVYLHLANTAEERHRMRVNAARDAVSVAEAPRRESLLALVGSLKEQGWSYEEAVSLLGSLRLHLTFTAHPTETRRWTVRGHLADIAAALDRSAERSARRAREPAGAGGAPVGDVRAAQRAPQRGGRSARRARLPPDGPLVGHPAARRELEHAVEAHFGRRPTLPPPVVFRSWIGGDRDGNPKVLPAVTAWAQQLRPRRGAAALRRPSWNRLARVLSISDQRVRLPETLRLEIADALAGLEIPAALANEPFRCLCLGMAQKLRALARRRRRAPAVPRDARSFWAI